MNKINKAILIVFFLFNSCQNSVHTTEIKAKKIASPIMEESFEFFFINFRKKAESGDVAGIKSLTLFPLKTRGDFDNMPYRYVAAGEFEDFYNYFSREFGGGKYQETLPNPLRDDTNLYELSHADLERDVGGLLDGSEYRLGRWVFEKINGKWYFAFAYTDYFERNLNR